MRQTLLPLLLQLVIHATAEVDIFRSDCGQCGQHAVCEDILVKTQRDMRRLEHPHVKEGTLLYYWLKWFWFVTSIVVTRRTRHHMREKRDIMPLVT